MLPLAQPAIVTVTIFNFIALWNDYFWALILFLSEKIIAGITVGAVKA